MFYACIAVCLCASVGIIGLILSFIDIDRFNFGLYLTLLSVVGTTIAVAFWIVRPEMCASPLWFDRLMTVISIEIARRRKRRYHHGEKKKKHRDGGGPNRHAIIRYHHKLSGQTKQSITADYHRSCQVDDDDDAFVVAVSSPSTSSSIRCDDNASIMCMFFFFFSIHSFTYFQLNIIHHLLVHSNWRHTMMKMTLLTITRSIETYSSIDHINRTIVKTPIFYSPIIVIVDVMQNQKNNKMSSFAVSRTIVELHLSTTILCRHRNQSHLSIIHMYGHIFW